MTVDMYTGVSEVLVVDLEYRTMLHCKLFHTCNTCGVLGVLHV